MERIFELRMTISESESQAELKEIKSALVRDYGTELSELSISFQDDIGSARRKEILNRARYLQKMIEEVDAREESLREACM
jgi:hypothetical protein